MKKLFYVLVLLGSISGELHAQNFGFKVSNASKRFDITDWNFVRRFQIDLGRGNKLQIELKDLADLDRIRNLDSILNVFLQDIEPLKDSFSEELTAKRIDYLIDSTGKKEIRFQQFKPEGSSFVLNKGDLAALKLEQDTVNLIGVVTFQAKYTMRKGFRDTRYYKLSFLINSISELPSVLTSSLNDRIATLKKNVHGGWKSDGNGSVTMISDPGISAKLPQGYFTGHGDFLTPDISVNLQNYKNYFVPSFALGVKFIISNSEYKREIGLHWEPQFLFQSTQGRVKTFRNDFLSFSFGQGPIKDNDPMKESNLQVILSFGYLIHREGEFYDPHTIRIGLGRLSLFEGKTKIEPIMYFHDFFREVTPGLRWIQHI
jgi:hypothetical protein